MEAQKDILLDAWGCQVLVAANFSDGAVYTANFYAQGVDYFELLHGTGQNAVWGEDWANASSTFQLGAYNAQLMQAAARKRGQSVGSYLIACDGRTALDIKLKAVALVSRGVRTLDCFYYGPAWAGYEKGMLIRSPELWSAVAEVVREVGAVEDWLLEARPRKAGTALLYSSASDIWTLNRNHAFGFDRMHTWLALAHAQVPVDIIHETEAAEGLLKGYKVCYLSGTHLTSACAEELRRWVLDGGTLILTADAASFDEYNRKASAVDKLLPVERLGVQQLEPRLTEGRGLGSLSVRDAVKTASCCFDVLSVKQGFKAPLPASVQVMGTYADWMAPQKQVQSLC